MEGPFPLNETQNRAAVINQGEGGGIFVPALEQ